MYEIAFFCYLNCIFECINGLSHVSREWPKFDPQQPQFYMSACILRSTSESLLWIVDSGLITNNNDAFFSDQTFFLSESGDIKLDEIAIFCYLNCTSECINRLIPYVDPILIPNNHNFICIQAFLGLYYFCQNPITQICMQLQFSII